MQYTSHHIAVGKEQIHYLEVGHGPQLLVGFPGYGHNAHSLLPLAQYLDTTYTCVLADMPHHGNSRWTPGVVFTKAMLVQLITSLLDQYKCPKISLLGYSMGGRVCLTIIEELPQYVERATLIASDGLVNNKYYTFVTGTVLGKRLFAHLLTHPAPYHKMILLLKRARLISPWQYKFISYYTGDPMIRKKLSLIWPAMSALIPSAPAVHKAIRQYNIQVHLFMGKFDKVIPASHGRQFAAGNTNIHLHILEKGHSIIGYDTAREIAGTLLTDK